MEKVNLIKSQFEARAISVSVVVTVCPFAIEGLVSAGTRWIDFQPFNDFWVVSQYTIYD
jgi:hypothetical protein